MMNSIKFNEWQEMALKKDTETIIKKLNSQDSIFFSMCWEIVLAIGVIILDHLFNTEEGSIYIWILCFVLAIAPPVIVLAVNGVKYIRAVKRSMRPRTIKDFVDEFDNKICYWVMMSNSYMHLLMDSSSGKGMEETTGRPKNSKSDSEKVFLYQEGCYYINKSIFALYKVSTSFQSIFINVTQENYAALFQDGRVMTSRLKNIIDLILEQQKTMDECVEDLKDNALIIEQKAVSDAYLKYYLNRVVSRMNDLDEN